MYSIGKVDRHVFTPIQKQLALEPQHEGQGGVEDRV